MSLSKFRHEWEQTWSKWVVNTSPFGEYHTIVWMLRCAVCGEEIAALSTDSDTWKSECAPTRALHEVMTQ